MRPVDPDHLVAGSAGDATKVARQMAGRYERPGAAPGVVRSTAGAVTGTSVVRRGFGPAEECRQLLDSGRRELEKPGELVVGSIRGEGRCRLPHAGATGRLAPTGHLATRGGAGFVARPA
jgi:hypothetical protein